jgi:hypothetical protein
MDQFMSYKPYRREWYKGHASVKGVGAALQYGTNGLRIFEIVAEGEELSGYVEIPRNQWRDRFGYLGD